MRIAVWSMNTLKKQGILCLCIAAAVIFLLYPQALQNGVRQGLAVCGELLIPSLFPFLVLTGFMIRSGSADTIARLAAPLMRRVFGFSGEAATAMIASMLGGYPVGANTVATLCEQGRLSPTDGKRLLRCCVCGGPAFIIGSVGVGMLGSVKAGFLLLAAHWIAFLSVALLQRESPKESAALLPRTALSVGTAFTDSIQSAVTSLLSMCGFVLLTSGCLSLIDAMGTSCLPSWCRCLLACITEVCNGCVEAAAMGRYAPFWLGAALGFGGLSVHGQIASRTHMFRLVDGSFFVSRLLHALLGGCLSAVFLRNWCPQVLTANAALSSFTQSSDAAGLSGLIGVMLMCVLFLLTPMPQRIST